MSDHDMDALLAMIQSRGTTDRVYDAILLERRLATQAGIVLERSVRAAVFTIRSFFARTLATKNP